MDNSTSWKLAGWPEGHNGNEQLLPPTNGQAGKKGETISPESTANSHIPLPIQFADKSSELWASMNLRKAESDYANGDTLDAKNRLLFLLKILSSGGSLQSQEDLGITSMSAEAILARITGLLDQLSLGMDYFGQSEDFAPALSLEHYEDRLETLVEYAMKFETLHAGYLQNRDAGRLAIGELNQAIEEKRILIEASRAAASANLDKVSRLDEEIHEMASTIARLQPRCIELATEFKTDVEASMQGCSLGEALSVVGSIATAAASIKTGGLAAVAGGKKLWEMGRIGSTASGGEAFDAFSDRIKVIGEIGKGVSEVAEGFKTIAEKLDQDPNEFPVTVTDDNFDSAKLLQKRADLEETIDPFRHKFASAKELLTAFDQFVETAVSRNNKMIEQLQARATAQSEYAIANLAEQEIEDVQRKLSEPKAADFWFFGQFFEQSKRDNLQALSYYYYQLTQAVNWWSGIHEDHDFMGPSALWFRQALARMRQRIDLELEKRREYQHGQLEDRYDDFSMKETFGGDVILSLVETGTCVFQIPIDIVSRVRRSVRASGIKITFSGANLKPSPRDDDPLRISFSALGVGSIVNSDDSIMRRHFPRRDTNYTLFVEDWSGRLTELGGSARYTEPPLSGLWRLHLPPEDHQRIEFENDFDVRIQFETKYLPI